MKKLCFTFLFLAGMYTSAQAQTEKGAKLIGGSGTLHIETEGSENTSIVLAPSIGFFAANNLAIGARIPFAYNKNEFSSVNAIGLAPFVRAYIGSTPTRLLLEGRAGINRVAVSFNSGFGSNADPDPQTNTYFGLGLGVTHFLNEHVGIELMANYDKYEESDFTFYSNGLNGINFNLGFQIYLPSKK